MKSKERFEFDPSITTWDPWVGENYMDSIFKKRILIIGESHYGDPVSREFTRKVVNELGIKNWNRKIPFFKNIVSVLGGNINTEDGRTNFWNSVSFCNLIQRPMKDRKERPTATDFVNGWNSLIHINDVLKPDLCIVFSMEAYNKLANAINHNYVDYKATTVSNRKIGRSYLREIVLTRGQFSRSFIFLKHPSAFFSIPKWRPALEDILTKMV